MGALPSLRRPSTVALRRDAVRAPILVLGVLSRAELQPAVRARADVVVWRESFLSALAELEAGKGRVCTSSSTAAWVASARVAAELTQCRRRLRYACFDGIAHKRKRLICSLGNRGSRRQLRSGSWRSGNAAGTCPAGITRTAPSPGLTKLLTP